MAEDPGATRRGGPAARVPTELEPGATVAQWQVVRAIASGGFGSVYEARHVARGTAGALKVLHPHLVGSPEIAARLVREAEIIAQLRHRNVVRLLDAGVSDGGAPYLVMELVRGTDLDAVLRERGRFAPLEALAVLEALCAAASAAHAHGAIHRDIKASNVLLAEAAAGDDERVVLIDFGIAKLLEDAGAELTASRQALGTPTSMAPEQIRGGVIDVRTDVYALGALAYHLLTGRVAFADASVTMSQYLHLHAARPRPSEAAPLPAAVDEVLARAMAIDPARRFADPLALFAAMRAALAAEAAAPAPRTITGAALLVRLDHLSDDLDDALFDDLDAILPLLEPIALAAGFTYLRDLGNDWLFVGEGLDAAVAARTAHALRDALAQRPTRHPAVTAEIAVRQGTAVVGGAELRGGELADPSSW